MSRAWHATNNDNQLCLKLKGSDTEQGQEANLLGHTGRAAIMGETLKKMLRKRLEEFLALEDVPFFKYPCL